MKKPKNIRSLDTIADSINRLARGNIIDIGDLLLEAKAQCEHGQWLDWLSAEFAWSVDSAERYMRVAELAAKIRSLRNLKLAPTTLYKLADRVDEDLPAIVKELAKHSTNTPLRPGDARRVIKIGIGRRRYGDYPDATLVQLAELLRSHQKAVVPWYEKVVTALLERKPDTDTGARMLLKEVVEEYEAAEEENDDEEVESILDGAPPELPPSITPPEPQKLGTDTTWAEAELFSDGVTNLLAVRTKPVGRFVGMFSPEELREVADFLLAIGAARSAATEATR
jgi:hypothetical protein